MKIFFFLLRRKSANIVVFKGFATTNNGNEQVWVVGFILPVSITFVLQKIKKWNIGLKRILWVKCMCL